MGTMSDDVSSSSIVQYLRGCNKMLFMGGYTAHQLIYSYKFQSILILSTCSLYMAFFFILKRKTETQMTPTTATISRANVV